MIEQDPFPQLVGLYAAKRKLNFYLEGYKKTNVMPAILLDAPKGTGKSTLQRLIAKKLTHKNDSSKIKPYIEINCSTLKDLDSFFSIVEQHLVDKEATLALDECENLPRELALAFCSILNPTSENKNKFTYNGNEYTFDFSKLSFIFATTEMFKILPPLLDRLVVVSLDGYKTSDLAEILARNLKDFEIEMGLLEKIAPTVRSNPRQAFSLSRDIKSYLTNNKKKQLTRAEWSKIFKGLGMYPLGLTPGEVELIKALKNNPNSSLTKIAGVLGHTVDNTRKGIEIYPLKMGIFEIKQAMGRRLTPFGERVWRAIENNDELELTTS